MRTVRELMEDAEKAGDEYRECVLTAARARADYERARSLKIVDLIASGVKGVSDRNEQADAEVLEEREAHLLAEAMEKAANVNVKVQLGLMVAAQSELKHTGAQDGGGEWWPT